VRRRFVEQYAYSDAYAYTHAYTYAYFYTDAGWNLYDRRYRHARDCDLARHPGHRDCDGCFVGLPTGEQ
jgi:hypothetical protein